LNLPPGEEPEKHPELQVGVLSMFGLPESSRSTDQHANNGLSYTQEVTGLYLRLTAMRTWDPKNLRVTFVPRRWDDDIQVNVGRVSLVFQ
jgi:hypothetical protein